MVRSKNQSVKQTPFKDLFSGSEGLISRCNARRDSETVSPKLSFLPLRTPDKTHSWLILTVAMQERIISFQFLTTSTVQIARCHQARQIRTLIRNSNRLSEPDCSRQVIMYSRELPTCLVEQVTKMGYRAFLAVEIGHHLWGVKTSAQVKPAFWYALPTIKSELYTIEVARPKFGSNGFGGTRRSAPGISCATGSSQAHAISRSMMTSWVLGPAAARRCFSMVRQYSSAQSWSIWQTTKTDISSCCAGCGSKKLWPW